jgi:hypothetical protein
MAANSKSAVTRQRLMYPMWVRAVVPRASPHADTRNKKHSGRMAGYAGNRSAVARRALRQES